MEDESNKWRCSFCQTLTGSLEQLREHVLRHIFNVPSYQCNTCKRNFNEKEALLKHKVQHNGSGIVLDEGYTYINSFICFTCGRMFSNKAMCAEHMIQHKMMTHVCVKCGWMFGTPYGLRVHQVFWHERRKKRSSSKKGTVDQAALPNGRATDDEEQSENETDSETTTDHVNEDAMPRVGSVKKYRCNIKRCLAVEETYEDLTTHKKICHNLMNRSCRICSRVLVSDDGLQYHEEHHSDMMYICLQLYCGQMFESFLSLQGHLKQTHKMTLGIVDQSKYTVRKCTRSKWEMSTQKTLQSNCPICCRRFYDDNKLQHHVQQHCFLKYRCPEVGCHYMYEFSKNLMAHCSLRHAVTLSESDVDKCIVSETGSKELTEMDKLVKHLGGDRKNRNCFMCGRLFGRIEDLRNHVDNHQNMQVKCPQESCGWEYETFMSLYRHCFKKHKMTIGKDEEELYAINDRKKTTVRCVHKECAFFVPDAFPDYESLLLHLKTAHRPVDKRCQLCKRFFSRHKDFNRHIRHHNNLDMYKCPESSCGYMYETFLLLYTHCKGKHKIQIIKSRQHEYLHRIENDRKQHDNVLRIENDRPKAILPAKNQAEINSPELTCPVCSRVFKSQTKFAHHIENHASMNYKCNKCRWEFTEFKALQIHHREAHRSLLQISRADEPWYRLQRVDSETNKRTRRTRSQRRSDEANKPEQRRYPCPILNCRSGYEEFAELERHFRFVHKTGNGVCPVCNRVFHVKDVINYRAHVQKHGEA